MEPSNCKPVASFDQSTIIEGTLKCSKTSKTIDPSCVSKRLKAIVEQPLLEKAPTSDDKDLLSSKEGKHESDEESSHSSKSHGSTSKESINPNDSQLKSPQEMEKELFRTLVK